jgi:hypothetical protein
MVFPSNFAISCLSHVILLQVKFDSDLPTHNMLLDLFETAFAQFPNFESFPW